MSVGDRIRLLVVDDDRTDFQILLRHLETIRSPKYELTHAATIDEARIAIADNSFEAALIDYCLSGADNGLDFIAELGGREAPFPIILLTGMEDSAIDRQAMLSGAYEYIDKIALTRDLVDRTIRFSISSFQYEAQLRETLAEATEQAEVNRRILSVVSHEMKSPISSIIGYSDYIIESATTDAARNAAEMMKTASVHLQDFLVNLSEFVRLDEEAVELSVSSFHLKTMLEDTVELFQPYARHKHIRLVKQIDPSADGYFLGDKLRIRQIMLNLLKNAIYYSDGGSIVVSATFEDDMVKTRIEDQGVGISDDLLDRIKSEQIHHQNLGGGLDGGLGIGLSICQRLLRLMGGALVLQSAPGAGTTAGFDLPLAREEVRKSA